MNCFFDKKIKEIKIDFYTCTNNSRTKPGMLQFSLSFDSRDIFVSFPVSFRNKCKYKSSF